MSATTNGPSSAVKTDKPTASPRVVLAGKTGRILCVADIRGDYHELNRLIRVHDATAVIHTGDFGFLNAESLERMNDKILRHLLEHSPLIPAATRAQLLAIPASAGRNALINALNASSLHFPLSQFPHLLDGAVTFPVPVFTNWGLIEDFRVLERFRTGEYEVKNLTIIDEASSGLVEVGGVKLRLFGLGGTVSLSKLCEGHATIAGGQGVMWTTALQIGELLETAQRTFDPSETRLLITSSPVGRNGVLSLLANALKADLTISGGLHFRYSSSFNDFAVHTDFADYRAKLIQARDEFLRIYTTVKDRVDSSLNDAQQSLMKQALSLTQAIPNTVEESTWANTWNWVLSDASCGHMALSITDGRVTAETKSRGLNFAHRTASQQPIAAPAPSTTNARAPPHQDAKAPPAARAGFTAGVPTKPGAQAPTGPAGVKNILPRPQPGQPPIGKQPPTGPAGANAVPSSIPARPPTQPRQPRVPPTQVAPGKERPEKVADSAPAKSAPPKAPTPQAQAANGKPATPIPAAKEKEKEREKERGKQGSAKKELNGSKEDVRKDEKEKKERPKKEEKKEDKEEKETAAAPSPAPADKEDKSTEDGDSPATPEPRPRKPSLYLKGIPSPTTEEEVKALFPDASKITAVKIIMDHVTKKQRDFAYVDFDADADMQEALKAHKDVIRDTTINVSVSNPPPRTTFGTRGRGAFRRGGRTASGPVVAGGKKE